MIRDVSRDPDPLFGPKAAVSFAVLDHQDCCDD
jgi:hypothetical protein